MKYILMAYVNEGAWPKMTKAEQEQGAAAYMAYSEALNKAGVLAGSNRSAAYIFSDHGPDRERQSRRCWMARMSIRKSSSAATF